MASKTSNKNEEWQGRTLDMNAFGRKIAAHKAALGLPDDLAHPELVGSEAEAMLQRRNASHNRTPSKRALLKAIDELGGEW